MGAFGAPHLIYIILGVIFNTADVFLPGIDTSHGMCVCPLTFRELRPLKIQDGGSGA
jgi:hypothetical protein